MIHILKGTPFCFILSQTKGKQEFLGALSVWQLCCSFAPMWKMSLCLVLLSVVVLYTVHCVFPSTFILLKITVPSISDGFPNLIKYIIKGSRSLWEFVQWTLGRILLNCFLLHSWDSKVLSQRLPSPLPTASKVRKFMAAVNSWVKVQGPWRITVAEARALNGWLSSEFY